VGEGCNLSVGEAFGSGCGWNFQLWVWVKPSVLGVGESGSLSVGQGVRFGWRRFSMCGFWFFKIGQTQSFVFMLTPTATHPHAFTRTHLRIAIVSPLALREELGRLI
jgi:hypothetical protein